MSPVPKAGVRFLEFLAMVRCRIFIASLMLLLLPLQGLATASDFSCWNRAGHHWAAAASVSAGISAGSAAHSKAAKLATQPILTPNGLRPAMPDLSEGMLERCRVCASLCHTDGITQAFASSPTAQQLRSRPTDALFFMVEQPFAVADKPPRALRV